jgi:hypothetical protein
MRPIRLSPTADCLLERAAADPDYFELALRTLVCMGRARNTTPIVAHAKHCISQPFDYKDIVECAQVQYYTALLSRSQVDRTYVKGRH